MIFKQGEWMFSFELKSGMLILLSVIVCTVLVFWKLLHVCCVAIWIFFRTLCLHKDDATFDLVMDERQLCISMMAL